jgi:tRNA threonylcarbamoyladenosine dehydratase
MMNNEWQSRTELLIGEDGVKTLSAGNILIVGTGGVGAYSAECICRAGIGKITLVDGDTVSETNINRQLPATHKTVGMCKTEVLKLHFKNINPQLQINTINKFLTAADIAELLDSENFNYIIDAIDTLVPKVALCLGAITRNIPIISSMGAGGRIDPTKIQVADISKTYNDGLAAAFRQRLRKNGIYKNVKVVFSTETPNPDAVITTSGANNQRSVRGTISYLPAIFGCMIAGEVIRDLLKKQNAEDKA